MNFQILRSCSCLDKIKNEESWRSWLRGRPILSRIKGRWIKPPTQLGENISRIDLEQSGNKKLNYSRTIKIICYLSKFRSIVYIVLINVSKVFHSNARLLKSLFWTQYLYKSVFILPENNFYFTLSAFDILYCHLQKT